MLMLIAIAHQSIRRPREADAVARRARRRRRPERRGAADGDSPRLGIGVLATAGVYLMLRPRTFQVIIGLTLTTYAVNLFLVALSRVKLRRAASWWRAPWWRGARTWTPCRRRWCSPHRHLVLHDGAVPGHPPAARGLTGTDHVDGEEGEK